MSIRMYCHSLPRLIQKCTTITSLKEARQLHALILTSILDVSYAQTPYLNNNLISMYARCRAFTDAQKLFAEMPHRNLVSYNTLISTYSRDSSYGNLSFELLSHMGFQGFKPNGTTFTSLLQACCFIEDLFMGCYLHGKVVKFGFLDNVIAVTSLLGMYSSCGDVNSMKQVFYYAAEKDVVTWNSMILGNLKNDKVKEAVFQFCNMVRSGFEPTKFTYSMLFNACSKLGYCNFGKMVHARILVFGMVVDLPVQNALLDMYCSCGDMRTGYNVFTRMENRDLVSWNSMISGSAENGAVEEAMNLFVQLLRMSAPKPDDYTFVAVISASGGFPAINCRTPLHAQVIKVGLEDSIFVGTTLLSMYSNNNDSESAQRVFDMIEKKDIVLWTEMIMVHARLGDGETAMKLFCKMHEEGHKSDSFAISGALSACADLATLKQGEMIHSQAVRTGCDVDMSVCGSLINMYAKNGNLEAAQSIFSLISDPDLKCWNSMLGGYSQYGMVNEALELFDKILEHGMKPDQRTLLSLLYACSHSGHVKKGKFLWNFMKESGIMPGPRHYSCMVSLLARAGLLDEAEDLIINSTYSEENLEVWRTLLSCCVTRRNFRVGVHAAEQVLRLDPADSATHILLSNLYAAAGRWDGVAQTRQIIRRMMLEKDPGLSWIEAENHIHVFSSGEQLNQVVNEALEEVHRLQGNMKKSIPDDLETRMLSNL